MCACNQAYPQLVKLEWKVTGSMHSTSLPALVPVKSELKATDLLVDVTSPDSTSPQGGSTHTNSLQLEAPPYWSLSLTLGRSYRPKAAELLAVPTNAAYGGLDDELVICAGRGACTVLLPLQALKP